MTIETSSDISKAVPTILTALPKVAAPFQLKLVAAIQCPSVVDTIAQAFEVFYTAMHEDTVLATNATDLAAVATATKQLGYYLTYYSWHGKTQRAANVGVVCEQVASGTSLATLSDAPGVDPDFTTIYIPLQQAPHEG